MFKSLQNRKYGKLLERASILNFFARNALLYVFAKIK